MIYDYFWGTGKVVTAGALLDLTEHKRHRSAASHKYMDTKKNEYWLENGKLTWGSCLPRSSGFWGGRPTAEHPRFQIWRRQRSRAAARCPAWAGCRAGGSPGCAYLREETRSARSSMIFWRDLKWQSIHTLFWKHLGTFEVFWLHILHI